MRRTVAAIVLAGLVSMTALVPSASAQIPGLESWGFSGNTPFFSTSLFGPGPVQCQFGGYVGVGGAGATSLGAGNVSPFFTASAAGPVPPIPGPCTPPPFLLGGLGLGGVGGVGSLGLGGGIANLTLAQALGLGLGTTATAGGVTTVTIAGQTRTLTGGQSVANTTVGTVFPNIGAGAGFGLGGVGSLGLNTGLGFNTGLAGLGGIGTGFGFNTGLGGLTGLGSLTGFNGLTGVVR